MGKKRQGREKRASRGKGAQFFSELMRKGLWGQRGLEQSPEGEDADCRYLWEKCPRQREQPVQSLIFLARSWSNREQEADGQGGVRREGDSEQGKEVSCKDHGCYSRAVGKVSVITTDLRI